MERPYKKIGKIVVVFTLLLSLVYSKESNFVKAEGETITIEGIFMKDNGLMEPDSYSSVKYMIENDPKHRTGWSGIIFSCNNDLAYDSDGKPRVGPDGNIISPWSKENERRTDDSGRDKKYSVTDYRTEIVNKYGNDVYQKALDAGASLTYDGKGTQVVYSKDTRSYPCNDGDKAFFYNNLSFNLTTTFTVAEPEPEPEIDPVEDNNPPIAQVSSESFHYWPEIMNISTIAYDPDDDDIVEKLTVDNVSASNAWQSSRVNKKVSRNVLLQVTDEHGATAEAYTSFETWPTIPTAATDVTGKLKVNRAVKVDAKASNLVSPVHVAPIDYGQTTWKITPITEGVTAADIKERPSSDKSIKQWLFKKAGTYRVEVTVTNKYGETSEVHFKDLEIIPDEYPISNFKVDKSTYLRDKTVGKETTVTLTDSSVSLDGDIIGQRFWYVEFDANNDGVFGTPADGGKQLLSNANLTTLTYKTKHVGNYRFSLDVKEKFSDPTYEEFVLPEEYLLDGSDILDPSGSVATYREPLNFNKDNYEVGIELINVPPVIDFGVKRKNKIELLLDFGGMDTATRQHQTGSAPGGGNYNHYYYNINTADKNALTNYAGTLEANLRSKGLDVTVVLNNNYFRVLDTDGTCIQNIPVYGWVDYGGYQYSSYSGTSPYNGGWEVTSSSSTDVYKTVVVWCSNPNGGGHRPPCVNADNAVTEEQYSHTNYTASLRRYVSDYRYERTGYTSQGCSSAEQVDTTDFVQPFASYNYSDADYRYYYRMDKSPWTWRMNSTKLNQMYNKIRTDNVFLWNNSDNSLRLDAQLLNANAQREGKYTQFNTSYLQSNIQKVQDFMLNKYMINEDSEIFTIVLGDEVDYTTVYEDFESDPELQREWKFVHDHTSVNDREIDGKPSGPIAQSGMYINEPMQLTEVGTYSISLRAKDNPLSDVGNDGRFANYQKWSDSEIVREYKINVHRRPIADFIAEVEPGTLKLNLDPSSSFDPDHQFNWSSLGISENGIVEYTWEKYVVDGVEYDGEPPTNLQPSKDYFISLRVKDVDGAYGTVTKMVSTQNINLKPIALFDSPGVVLRTTSLNDSNTQNFIRDRSYDPNGDPLTNYSWTIKTQSNGTVVWSGSEYPSSFATAGLGAGKYLLGLTVWDIPKNPPTLQSDLYEKEITVIDNNPPNSCFEMSRAAISATSVTCDSGQTSPYQIYVDESAIYTDKSTDPDGHSLINYSWLVEKLADDNSVIKAWNTGSPPISFNSFGGVGKYRITQTVFDKPPSPLPSLSGKYVRYFDVIKGPQAPFAMFTNNPINPIEGDTIQLTDTSWDEDGEVVEWEYRIEAPNGSITTQSVKNPSIINAQKGTYKIWLNVWDNNLPVKLKSKLAAYKEIIVAERILEPPTAIFIWEPYKPFLGETFNLDPDGSYDLDGTITQYSWSIRSKEGVVTTSTERYPSMLADSAFYDVSLTVRDSDNLTHTTTERIEVDIAKLKPFVTHTTDWKAYWVSEGFEADAPIFLAGEKFVIEVITTPARSVEGQVYLGENVGDVTIPSSAFTLVSTGQFEYVWRTTLWQDDFETIKPGLYNFSFKGYHPDVTTPTVISEGNYNIEVVGNVYDVLNFHRNY